MKVFGSVDEMMHDMLCITFSLGRNTSPRGSGTREVLGYMAAVSNPRRRLLNCPVRPIRRGYPAAKVAWDLARRDDLEGLEFWNPNASHFAREGTFMGENYGQRIGDNLWHAIDTIRGDEDTRRPFVEIFHPDDIEAGGDPQDVNPVPCTIGFQLRVWGGELVAFVVMRSQSVLGVFPYDFFWATAIQEIVANELGLPLGPVIWNVISLHIYDRDVTAAAELIEWYAGHDTLEVRSPAMLPIAQDLQGAEMRMPQLLQEVMDPKAFGTHYGPVSEDPLINLMLHDAAVKHGLAAYDPTSVPEGVFVDE